MNLMTRRSAFAAFAAALLAPVVARAQGATGGPAGGVSSTTAPSNSQGTPAGGTGVIGGSRVGTGAAPVGASPNTPLVGGEPGTSETPPRRRRRRRARRRAAPSTAQ